MQARMATNCRPRGRVLHAVPRRSVRKRLCRGGQGRPGVSGRVLRAAGGIGGRER